VGYRESDTFKIQITLLNVPFTFLAQLLLAYNYSLRELDSDEFGCYIIQKVAKKGSENHRGC
jgi:hypothetical protein